MSPYMVWQLHHICWSMNKWQGYRYLTDCDNCTHRETTLVAQHSYLRDYDKIIQDAIREKFKSSEKAHKVKPSKVGPGSLVFLKTNPQIPAAELERRHKFLPTSIGN